MTQPFPPPQPSWQQYGHQQPPQWGPPGPPTPRPPRGAKKRKWPWVFGGVVLLAVIIGSVAGKETPGPAADTDSATAPVAADPAESDSTPGQDFTAGQTVERDGVQITAEPLRKVKLQYTDRRVCSTITYRNGGSDEAPFNLLNWKIQNPAGVQSNAVYALDDGLKSGQLAPGGTVTGDVCIIDQGAPGDYLVIHEGWFADPIRWAAKL
ncbi:MAG: hypothetical protein JNM77_17625 [Pseudonocardia sp.]|nr:hypothetical protein [Pseudonocardia sp.]